MSQDRTFITYSPYYRKNTPPFDLYGRVTLIKSRPGGASGQILGYIKKPDRPFTADDAQEFYNNNRGTVAKWLD